MFELVISEDDERWLNANYPELKIGKDNVDYPPAIKGLIKFDMVFYHEDEPYVINPGPEHFASGYRIQDEYQIEIVLKSSEHSNLPQVFERGGRLESVVVDRDLKLTDLHINPEGVACLCLSIEEENYLPNGFTLQEFFNSLVIPFFYAQSYFEKNNSWPWGQYGHGSIGIFEWCSNQSNITEDKVRELLDRLKRLTDWKKVQPYLDVKKKVKGHYDCLCGSKRKFRNCHEEALYGMRKMKQNMEAYSECGITF